MCSFGVSMSLCIMSSALCPPSNTMASYRPVPLPWNLHAPPTHPPPFLSPLTSAQPPPSLTTSILLPLLECHMPGPWVGSLSAWLLSCGNMHVSFLCVFSWLLIPFFFFLNEAFSVWMHHKFLSVHLLRDNSLSSNFWQLRIMLQAFVSMLLCGGKFSSQLGEALRTRRPDSMRPCVELSIISHSQQEHTRVLSAHILTFGVATILDFSQF